MAETTTTTNESNTTESGTENGTKTLDLDEQIIAQVEYYFGDLNLNHDKFMKFHINQNDGWLPLDKLMTFNRLKKLTTDSEVVANAIKKSTSGLLEVSECNTKVRRIKPVPEQTEEYLKELNLRTLHLKNFPKDSVLDDIMDFCKQFGKVEFLQMRRNFKNKNQFKGCILVTYASREDAEKVLNEHELKYKDTMLLRENKERYFERKKEYMESRKNKKNKQNAGGDVVLTKKAILKIIGLDQEVKFSSIKEELSKHSKVAFVSHVNPQSECFVRFANEDGAKTALEALQKDSENGSEKGPEKDTEKDSEKDTEKKDSENNSEDKSEISIELLGQKVNISLVSGEEEVKFWTEFQSKQSMGHKGRNNKWQRGKKRGGENDDKHNQKKTKV